MNDFAKRLEALREEAKLLRDKRIDGHEVDRIDLSNLHFRIGQLISEFHRDVLPQAKRISELEEELRVTDALLERRNEVLRAIPGCNVHGDQCIPHALDWIAKAKLL